MTLPKITYISHDGERRTVEAENGRNLMETAISNGVPGIDGDCGGACSCATCHVHVAPEWLATVGGAGLVEAEMLEMVHDAKPNSRLACQIVVTNVLDGLVVQTPERQGG